MKIAVLGLGRMGEAIAFRLKDGGHDLTVWNRSGGKARDLLSAGANAAERPDDAVASAEVVITSLSGDDAVREIALGDDGIRSAIGSRVYVDTSTISPTLSAELDEAFENFVALPVLGAPQAVRSGHAIYLAGGKGQVVDAIEPVLGSLSEHVKRYARPEMASSAKLAMNLLLLSGIATLAESLAVGRAGGLSDDEMRELLLATPMLAPGLKNRLDGVIRGSGPDWWTTRLAAKDARLAVEAAGSAGKALRLGPVIHDLYQAAAHAGFDEEDMIAVAHLYE